MKKINLILLVLVLTASFFAQALELKNQSVNYGTADKKFVGYLTQPKNINKATPALLIVHNWMGLTEETKKQADRLAQLGYIVFAADIYGQGRNPKDAKAAGELSGKFKKDRQLLRQNLTIALDELKKQKNVDAKQVAVAGYCFGGTSAVELARTGADIAGAISFHGGLDSPTPADGKNIKAKVLALHGADDPFVAAADLTAFEEEMKTNKVDFQLVKFGNTVHSFTEKGAGNDNTKGAAYNVSADVRSFKMAENFLSEIFKKNK
jgi:dienelactone hydrolase